MPFPLNTILQLRRDLEVMSELTGNRVIAFQVIFLTMMSVCWHRGRVGGARLMQGKLGR